jgi:hypothetical protein
MSNWIERVKESIAPLSFEADDVRKMLKEWYYTGNCNDLGGPCETCKLCGHPDIRYQFEIRNRDTSQELLIGSECITRFDISAVDESGELLDTDATTAKVQKDRRKLITDAQRRRVINTLVQLAAAESEAGSEFAINNFIGYYQDRDAFTPKQLSFLVWRLGFHNIEYRKTDFKMIIRRKREKDQLKELERWKVQKMWPCMSDTQQQWYTENVITA